MNMNPDQNGTKPVLPAGVAITNPTRSNNATFLRRNILIYLARAALRGELIETADRIPFIMRPKKSNADFRCCIYKERAILRLRCLAGLGGSVEEDDDFTPLAEYAKKALASEKPELPVLTVIDIACKGCVESRFFVTELCQGCLARPCMEHCRFGAVSFTGGRAVIDHSLCKKCGLCQQKCPYHAISRIHVPCEEACPVDAIHKNEEGRAVIDFDKCTSCGRCMRACPFGAVMERSQIIPVLRDLGKGVQMVAIVAPAIVGQLPYSIGRIAAGLKKLGFFAVLPVAVGADQTSRHEAEEFVERMSKGERFMTTSCCPAYVAMAQRHVPELLPFISNTPTPMHYTAELAKSMYPDCQTVFIGPCVAKRAEGIRDEQIDRVLTFEEMGAMFVAAGIEPAELPEEPLENATPFGKGFAVTGGVTVAVAHFVEENSRQNGLPPVEIRPVCVNGLSPMGIKQLRTFAKGECPGNLVEVMTCEGGCVAGAGTMADPRSSTRAIRNYVGDSDSCDH